MAKAPYGLSALMEATKFTSRKEAESNSLLEAYEDRIGDDVIAAVTGQEDDSLKSDMDGEGVGDEEEMQRLLDKIPPSDKMDEDQVEQITESFFEEAHGEAVM